MGMTIIEKILARAGGQRSVGPGDLVDVDVDTVVLFDSSFFPVDWREVLKVFDPDKLVVAFDHRIPAPNRACAEAQVIGRAFVKRFGIKRFHDVGYDQGIAHVLAAECGYALPGTVLVCQDSHTGSAGALNCAARGIGAPDMIYATTTGKAWFEVCPTVRYELSGALQPGVVTKDVFLHLAGTYGDHTGTNSEFGGPGLAGLSIAARRTIATMGTELNSEFSTFEADEVLFDYLETLMNAGAVVTNATCGACGGGHLGILGPNETCITASTRNYKGRMGDPSARIYMASPATVAASAIAGTITHPGEFLAAGQPS